MIEQALTQFITSEPTIKAILGVDKNGTAKVYWILAPQGSPLPFLVLSRVATTDTYAMGGSTGLRDAIFQFVCYSSDYFNSRNIANVVRLFLQDYTGTLPDGTVVESVMVEKDWDMQYEEGGKGFIYGSYLQFRVWHRA